MDLTGQVELAVGVLNFSSLQAKVAELVRVNMLPMLGDKLVNELTGVVSFISSLGLREAAVGAGIKEVLLEGSLDVDGSL